MDRISFVVVFCSDGSLVWVIQFHVGVDEVKPVEVSFWLPIFHVVWGGGPRVEVPDQTIGNRVSLTLNLIHPSDCVGVHSHIIIFILSANVQTSGKNPHFRLAILCL